MLKKQAICSVAYLKRGKDRYNMIEGKGGAMDIKLHYQEKGSGYPLIFAARQLAKMVHALGIRLNTFQKNIG